MKEILIQKVEHFWDICQNMKRTLWEMQSLADRASHKVGFLGEDRHKGKGLFFEDNVKEKIL